MSLFNLPVPLKTKEISRHPWANTIKDVHSSKIKYAHNSVKNRYYPLPKEKVPEKDRVKFTVIGNRITKEFIYCVNLLKGLHKYRWKSFDAPIIRGVTTVEWPQVWNELKIQHGGLAYCLENQVAILMNNRFLGGEKELKALIEQKYIYHLCLDFYKESVALFANFIKSSGRPCVYMHVSIDEKHIGTLIFMLYGDIVPYTCENFLRLCHETKGGYSGTPVHRIVKDSWIQCGGYGLKTTNLDCENFIVPFDKRGVLGMANDGRHVDCSTQFFVLLQAAPWVAHKYVAFGQLIDGEYTLREIENVQTWYESPTKEIKLYKTGIFNMDCHDIMINRGAVEYIHAHIDDLVAFGELLIAELMERVNLEIELVHIANLEKEFVPTEGAEEEELGKNIAATQRFMRKKEEIQSAIRSVSAVPTSIDRRAAGAAASSMSYYQSGSLYQRPSTAISDSNKDFDVECYEYEYEPEEEPYKHVSPILSQGTVQKPEKPFYIELTDVPYPDEVDSEYDLKKVLRGDYCHECDLEVDVPQKPIVRMKASYVSDYFKIDNSEESIESHESLDSDDEKEIRRYLKINVDRVSFAGDIIKGIARGIGKHNLFEDSRKSELVTVTDEELRRYRLASMEYRGWQDSRDSKKVSISVPSSDKGYHRKIRRRQTGFVRPEELEIIHLIKKGTGMASDDDEDDEDTSSHRKVRIAPSAVMPVNQPPMPRRPTGFVRPPIAVDSEGNVTRQSVLTRLYEDCKRSIIEEYDSNRGPTLKDFKPLSETQTKNILLTITPNTGINKDDERERYLRQSAIVENESFEQVLNMQHGRKITHNISTDYVKTIDQIEHKMETSIRSLEFAKTRPSMTVSEYHLKNQKYYESTSKLVKPVSRTENKLKLQHGLRLPGDTPIYSPADDDDMQ